MNQSSPNFTPLLRAALAYYHASEEIRYVNLQKQGDEIEGNIVQYRVAESRAKKIANAELKLSAARTAIGDFIMTENKRSKSRIVRIRRAIGYFIAGK